MRVGILGGGQLARMLTLAAVPLGIDVLCLEKEENTCANVVARVLTGNFDDDHLIKLFAEQVDVVTFETENLPLTLVEKIAKFCKTEPSTKSLQICQDRIFEKDFCQKYKIPVAPYRSINNLLDLQNAVHELGFPALLKTRQFGYDGKGQYLLKTADDISKAWELMKNQPLILEGFIQFDCEVSIIAVRGKNGEIVFYPLTKNTHTEGILRLSIAPYENNSLQEKAQEYTKRILEALEYVGVLAIEFFVKDNELLVNEMAPRVHNSGHWTIEGAVTSQFENHLRAIAGLPLGSSQPIGFSAMFNCIGEEPEITAVLKIPDTHFHTYGKSARPGRKLGHITLHCLDKKTFAQKLDEVERILKTKALG